MARYLVVCIGIIVCCLSQKVQSRPDGHLDSLRQAILNSPNDSNKVRQLNKLVHEYLDNGEYANVIEYAKQSLKLAEQIHFDKGLVLAYRHIGYAYNETANYPEALKNYLKALTIADRTKDMCNIYKCYNGIGLVYRSQQKYDIAYEYFQKALQQAFSLKDQEGMSTTYSNIGNVEADRKRYNQAIINLEKSLYIDNALGNKEGVASSYVNLSNIFSHIGKYEQSISYNEKALKILEKLNRKWGMVIAHINIGSAYKSLKNFPEALKHLQIGMQMANEVDMTESRLVVYNELAVIYAAKRDFEKAYYYQAKAKQLNDSVFNIENSKQLSELKIRYEVEKKEAEINAKSEAGQHRRQILAFAAIINTIVIILIIITLFQRRIARNQKAMFKAVLESQENERQRIGRDLHDDVGPLLSAVKLLIEGLSDKYGEANHLSEDVQYAGNILDEAIKNVRTSSHNLTPSVLTNMGLVAAVEELANNINYTGAVQVEYEHKNFPKNIDPSVALNIYRIIQELLNNALKHAQASRISIKLIAEHDTILVEVKDNGKGFDAENALTKGIGMKNISGRVKMLNGEISIESTPGKGATTSIRINETDM